MWGKKDPTREVRAGIEATYSRLLRYCLVLTGKKDLADDLAQAACLRALEKAELFQSGTHFDRWIFRLTHNLWINDLRKQAIRRGAGISPIEEVDLPDTRPDQEVNILGQQVLTQIMALPEAQRSTVLLVYGEGYSYRDAADILDIPVGTVMSRLAGARTKLAQHFGD
ncbi:MAG: RNA polymerase sigma factor [Rhizobiaceae bacterium]